MPALTPPLITTRTELISEANLAFLPKKSPLYIRVLEKTDIEQIIHLRAKVFRALQLLSHQEYYIREENEHEFLLQHCGQIGETLGIFSDKLLVAYGILGYHTILEGEDFRTELQLPSTGLLAKTSQLSSCMVSPNFQGLGLHRLLIKKRIALSLAKGYDQCVAAVSSSNHLSRKNLFKAGFRIHWVGTPPNISIYYHILHCNLKQEKPKINHELSKEVFSSDIAQQQELLKQGYLGYADKKTNYSGIVNILFYRF